MKWKDTVASQCRWAELVAEALDLKDDTEVLWECSENDYQGSAEIVAYMGKSLGKNQFLHYAWTYGSCSGCDSWEDADPDLVKKEMKSTAAYVSEDIAEGYFFHNPEIVLKIKQHLSKQEEVQPIIPKGRFSDL